MNEGDGAMKDVGSTMGRKTWSQQNPRQFGSEVLKERRVKVDTKDFSLNKPKEAYLLWGRD